MIWTVSSNPIANMYGPWFLLFYFVYFLCIIWLTLKAHHLYHAVVSRSEPEDITVNLPNKIDPYFIAWLQHGKERVLRLAMMRLSYEDLLVSGQKQKKNYMRKSATNPDLIQEKQRMLNSVESLTLSCFEEKYEQSREWAFNSLTSSCQRYKSQAQQQGFIPPATRDNIFALIGYTGLILLLGMGVYKLAIAWGKGFDNIIFLSIMAPAFSWLYYRIFLSNRAERPELTEKGKVFLDKLYSSVPRDKQSLKQLDIAMLAVALSTANSIYSQCDFGRHAYKLYLIGPTGSAAAATKSDFSGGSTGTSATSSSNSTSDSDSSSDSSSSGCSGCGGCGGD
ncbi:TIGR04222 domain-containing membrane protein [Pragia fontium]|nr:TIGR04222 domain-containing membrane protein [Pragia fontium]